MDTLDILTPVGSQQPGEVIGGVLVDVLAANDEMGRLIGHHPKKPFPDSAKAVESIFSWRGVLLLAPVSKCGENAELKMRMNQIGAA